MITQEDRDLIGKLKQRGCTNHDIANLLHIHRNSVRTILQERSAQPLMENQVLLPSKPIMVTKKSHLPAKGISKLEPFKEYLQNRLQEFPLLRGTVLFQEIVDRGYAGKDTILKNYLRSIRPDPSPAIEVPFFETLPGRQMQVDFGSGLTHIAGNLYRIHYLVFVLGYSRMMYVEIVPNQNLETLISAHLNAFRYFGGIPLQGLYDNMRQLVHRIQKQKIFTAQWNDFTSFYDLETVLQAPYHPQTKGKVERMIPYVRDHVLYGKKYNNLLELEESKQRFLEEVANCRHHSVLQTRPIDRFPTEQEYLRSFHKLYPLQRMQERKVRVQGDVVIRQKRYFLSACQPGDKICILPKEEGHYRFFQKNTNREIPLRSICPEVQDYAVEMRSMQEYENFVVSSVPKQENMAAIPGGEP